MSRNSKRENEDFVRKEKQGKKNLNSQSIIIFNGKILQSTNCFKQSVLCRK